ncbi:hypothetical protein LSAT2_016006 [Lamellibrachia satsuma]|nr:hypothetical protein LSAT2_016006 [Lamellibrachia satsuma]
MACGQLFIVLRLPSSQMLYEACHLQSCQVKEFVGKSSRPHERANHAILTVAVLPALTEARCPDSVKELAIACRNNYEAQAKALLGDRTFYSGIDVETIRAICHALKRTMQCAQDLKKRCPDTQSPIDSDLSDLKSVAELCIYPDILEVYARNQNCFLVQGASSRSCYDAYHNRQQTVLESIYKGDDTSLDRLCSLQETLLRCIRSNVRANCNDEATRLVNLLVKPSLNLSERCSDDPPRASSGGSSKGPESNTKQSPPYDTINNSSPGKNGACTLRAHWLSGLILATLTIWQTWRQTWRLGWS